MSDKRGTIATPEEIAALPEGSVIADQSDDIFQLRGGLWVGYECAPLTSRRLAKYGRITVLRKGKP